MKREIGSDFEFDETLQQEGGRDERTGSRPLAGTAGKASEQNVASFAAPSTRPLTLTVKLNVLLAILTVLSFITRLWRLEEPRGVVFDETHFGLFTSFYMQRIFFFDIHPPLGKMMLAAMAYAAGFKGDFTFEKIGLEYPCDLPIWHLRLLPALCGAMLPPLGYLVLEVMGYNQWTATLGALLLLCDNSLLTQSRFILLDSMLLCFILLALLALLKFRQHKLRPFSRGWWIWLACLGTFLTCVCSIKYSGLFTAVVIMAMVLTDFWQILGDKTISNSHLFKHVSARVLLLVGLPVVLYTSIFYVHLALLYRSGPHDHRMTSAFQASLEGGLSKITQGQPMEVAYGSQITLRHTHHTDCWLHSHAHVYPLRYSESRGSSLQQQVTCYSFKDINNWWVVKDPEKEALGVESPPRPVRHGDVIQLIHGTTGRRLNSHDVAAPVSPQYMEVSCYVDYNISFPAQDRWRVEIVNHEAEGNVWKAIHSQIRLVHVNTSQAIKTTGMQLPDWAFYQYEVATDRVLTQGATVWNVEENKYSMDQGDETWDRNTKMGFFSKFWELQWKMLTANKLVSEDHTYRSDPIEWPFMERGIAYWMSGTSNAQVHLLGNPLIWWTADAGIIVYLVVMVIYAMRYQRACRDLTTDEWSRLLLTGCLLAGWLANYLPYFLMDRTLFLHHYLPALVCKILLLAATAEIVHAHVLRTATQRSLYTALAAVWVMSALLTYCRFLPFCCGTTALAGDEIEALRWAEGWGFLVQGKMIS